MRKIIRFITNKILPALILVGLLLSATPLALAAPPTQTEPPEEPTSHQTDSPTYSGPGILSNPVTIPIVDDPLAPGLSVGFDGPNYNTNVINTGGFAFIPPDPIAAAGPSHVVAVVNVSIEWRTKTGTSQHNESLQSFFTGTTNCSTALSPAPSTFTFDPKVIYDQYEDRFVVVTLERVTSPSNASRIYLAVSDDSNPNGTWYCAVIDSLTNISGSDTWADYPGFAVDEEAIYITNNMFTFAATPSNLGVRLWIVDKDTASGFYSGGAISQNIFDPYQSAGLATTTQPAHIFNTPTTLPSSVGTFLVSYSGLSNGVTEFIQIVRVDTPLTTPSFTQQYISLGDLEANPMPALPDAPQNNSIYTIEVNDRRALHAVWRDNSLWFTTTVLPPSGPDINETTAHWFEVNTNSLSSLTLTDQGNIGGEDIATDTYTFFPSVAVDQCGNVGFGFAASATTIYAGTYYTNRYASDAAGTVQSSGTNQAGLAPYYQMFSSGGGTRNRWGDYSGIALDPDNQSTFWVFNEYALTGTGTAEDGTWGTRYGAFPSGLDYGDLPSGYNNTVFGDDGARHCLGSVYLGSTYAPKTDGQENDFASADANDDGVFRDMSDLWQNDATVDISFDLTSSSGPVDIGLWIDWDSNGTFEGFFSFTSVAIGGLHTDQITVPSAGSYDEGDSVFARARVFPSGGAPGGTLDSTDFIGLASEGEVEDYLWDFGPNAISLSEVNTITGSNSNFQIIGGMILLILLVSTAYFIHKFRRI